MGVKSNEKEKVIKIRDTADSLEEIYRLHGKTKTPGPTVQPGRIASFASASSVSNNTNESSESPMDPRPTPEISTAVTVSAVGHHNSVEKPIDVVSSNIAGLLPIDVIASRLMDVALDIGRTGQCGRSTLIQGDETEMQYSCEYDAFG